MIFELFHDRTCHNLDTFAIKSKLIYFILLFELADDEEEDDQLLKELLQDPIFQTSMEENLTKFLQNFSQSERFAEYVSHLNENEKITLRNIQVNA